MASPRAGSRSVAPEPDASAPQPKPAMEVPGASFFGGLLTRGRTISDEDVRRMRDR